MVGMADPTNIFAYDELSNLLKVPIKIAVVREADLLRTIDTAYRKTDQISDFAESDFFPDVHNQPRLFR